MDFHSHAVCADFFRACFILRRVCGRLILFPVYWEKMAGICYYCAAFYVCCELASSLYIVSRRFVKPCACLRVPDTAAAVKHRLRYLGVAADVYNAHDL